MPLGQALTYTGTVVLCGCTVVPLPPLSSTPSTPSHPTCTWWGGCSECITNLPAPFDTLKDGLCPQAAKQEGDEIGIFVDVMQV